MAGKRRPGPEGGIFEDCRESAEIAWDWLRGAADRGSGELKKFGDRAPGIGKSGLLAILDALPVKPDSPYSTALLRHYVEGSGEPYDLESIPLEWQDWIARATKEKPRLHSNLNPYNSGIYDLRNSLGHFDVLVSKDSKTKDLTFEIRDIYEFGYIRNDRNHRGRHGFPLGKLDESTVAFMRMLLPADEYRNPGGFKERWEIVNVGKETILYIPQEVLASQGKPFKVHGKFVREKEGRKQGGNAK